MKHLCVLIGLLLLYPSTMLAEPIVFELMEASLEEDSLEEEPLKTSFYFQTGLFYRLGGHRFIQNEVRMPVMGTVDLSFLKLDPSQPTWGWGLHSAISDDNDGGLRFAPKVLYRIPFSKPTESFFEASGGLYLLAFNDFYGNGKLNLPGYFAEAGLGRNHVSIVLGAEAFPAENFEESETRYLTTNYWVGFKASQGHGLLVLGATGIVIGLFFLGYANSGLNS